MNIFFLFYNVKECAEAHVDKHVVKMILEYAQLMSTAHVVLDDKQVGYKKTHTNHPSAIWVRQSQRHYVWLFRLFECLLQEYTYRYGKIHKTSELLEVLRIPPENISFKEFVEPPQAMPDQYKVQGNSIEAYRNYYIHGKKHLHCWSKREQPIFFSMLSWQNTDAFKCIDDKKQQLVYYMENKSSPEVLRLAGLASKSFGTITEKIICEIFSIQKRTSSQNDGVIMNRKVEIKTARYWSGKDDCKWQHIEPTHDYDFFIFGLLGFSELILWVITKENLMKSQKLIKQGEQGYWVTKSDILPHLTRIHSKLDMYNFIQNSFSHEST